MNSRQMTGEVTDGEIREKKEEGSYDDCWGVQREERRKLVR